MSLPGVMLTGLAFSVGNTIERLVDFQKSGLLFYTDADGKKRRVTTLAEWEIKQKQILAGMQQGMGELPGFLNLPDMDIQIIDEIKEENYTRQNIIFTVVENEKVPAFLYLPNAKSETKKFPAMLALHETDSIGKKSVDGQGLNINMGYAKELAQRGYVVIAPDYPDFGDLKDYDFKTDRYQSGTMKSIFDNMRCVDLLQMRADVDPNRIGVIGHSLGGHNAMFTGAFDKRLKVIVSSCGWTLFDYDNLEEANNTKFIERYGGRLGDWAQERYMPLLHKFELNAKRNDSDPRKMPFDFDEVIAAIAPRSFFSNSPLHDSDFNPEGVRTGIAEASKVYRFLGGGDKIQVLYPDS
jgi:dipeptidyl aminopeptidase/acylaminoacyl peptidase